MGILHIGHITDPQYLCGVGQKREHHDYLSQIILPHVLGSSNQVSCEHVKRIKLYLNLMFCILIFCRRRLIPFCILWRRKRRLINRELGLERGGGRFTVHSGGQGSILLYVGEGGGQWGGSENQQNWRESTKLDCIGGGGGGGGACSPYALVQWETLVLLQLRFVLLTTKLYVNLKILKTKPLKTQNY